MKRIKLAVPSDAEFAAIRDLDGIVTEVADPKGGYRYKRGEAAYEFESTGRSVDADGSPAEVFTAVRVGGAAAGAA